MSRNSIGPERNRKLKNILKKKAQKMLVFHMDIMIEWMYYKFQFNWLNGCDAAEQRVGFDLQFVLDFFKCIVVKEK